VVSKQGKDHLSSTSCTIGSRQAIQREILEQQLHRGYGQAISTERVENWGHFCSPSSWIEGLRIMTSISAPFLDVEPSARANKEIRRGVVRIGIVAGYFAEDNKITCELIETTAVLFSSWPTVFIQYSMEASSKIRRAWQHLPELVMWR
jgi:hypothetical protein